VLVALAYVKAFGPFPIRHKPTPGTFCDIDCRLSQNVGVRRKRRPLSNPKGAQDRCIRGVDARQAPVGAAAPSGLAGRPRRGARGSSAHSRACVAGGTLWHTLAVGLNRVCIACAFSTGMPLETHSDS